MQALRLWHQHNEIALASLGALFLFTLIVLFMRSIGTKAADTGGSSTDFNAIETMLRKALAQSPGVRAGARVDAADPSYASDDSANTASSISADAASTIASLKHELEETRAAMAAQAAVKPTEVSASSRATDAGQPDGTQLEALQKKLVDLEARLAEYEIIEDDIADLSHFKEENMRLRDELAALRNGALESMAEEASPLDSGVATTGDEAAAALAQIANQMAILPNPEAEAVAAAAQAEAEAALRAFSAAPLAVAQSGEGLAVDAEIDAEKITLEATAIELLALEALALEAPGDDLLREFRDDKKEESA